MTYGRDTSNVYYDVTNYYFEIKEPDEFLKKEYLRNIGLPLLSKWVF